MPGPVVLVPLGTLYLCFSSMAARRILNISRSTRLTRLGKPCSRDVGLGAQRVIDSCTTPQGFVAGQYPILSMAPPADYIS
jgi:hypothetical protein